MRKMGKTLTKIAQQLKDANKKVQLIYAFNGMGKTRLSREFKQLIAPTTEGGEDGDEADQSELARNKILYYNAFTEDLFYWKNGPTGDAEPKLKIQPNSFTRWVLEEQGQDQNITAIFQHYVNEKLTPRFSPDYSEVSFSFERGNEEQGPYIKISKGEESCFVWSIFYCLIAQMVSELNIPEVTERSADVFNDLEYVFIDDPVSSLDENHLIELAVSLASLIKSNTSDVKFIISTHSPLFYNVLYNELNNRVGYILERFEDGTFALTEKHGDSNKSFSYHLYLKQTIGKAIAGNQVEKYHFTLLRNLYEKTATFLGYPKWSELLPEDRQGYLYRIIQFTNHNTLSNEAVAEPTPQEKQTVKLLLDHLTNNYSYWQPEQPNA